MQVEATTFINRCSWEPFKISEWGILFTNACGKLGAAPSLLPTVQGELKTHPSEKYRGCLGPGTPKPSPHEGGPYSVKITRMWGKVERGIGALGSRCDALEGFLPSKPMLFWWYTPISNNTGKQEWDALKFNGMSACVLLATVRNANKGERCLCWKTIHLQRGCKAGDRAHLTKDVRINLESPKWVNMEEAPCHTSNKHCLLYASEI